MSLPVMLSSCKPLQLCGPSTQSEADTLRSASYYMYVCMYILHIQYYNRVMCGLRICENNYVYMLVERERGGRHM